MNGARKGINKHRTEYAVRAGLGNSLDNAKFFKLETFVFLNFVFLLYSILYT